MRPIVLKPLWSAEAVGHVHLATFLCSVRLGVPVAEPDFFALFSSIFLSNNKQDNELIHQYLPESVQSPPLPHLSGQ